MQELKCTKREIILLIEDDSAGARFNSSSCSRDGSPRDIEEETDEEEGHVRETFAIQDLDREWLESVKERSLEKPKKLTLTSNKRSCTIHRVPHHMRELNKDAYSSSIVSFGPFHYKDRRNEPLLAMEEYKWKHLNDIISRKGDHWLESCLVSIKNKEKEVRRCYSEEFTDINSNAFVEMMLLDGCFIIVFFHNHEGLGSSGDPSNEISWVENLIVRDIYLLENQIPFTIIEILLDQIGLPHCPKVPSRCKTSNSTHLLHYRHSSITASIEKKCYSTELLNIPSARVVKHKRIKFKAAVGDENHFLDIKFENGETQIPSILIEDRTKEKLLNLVAFEQCYSHCNKYVTSYIYFMNCLTDTAKDVPILCKTGVIVNCLGSNEKVAVLFNVMGYEVNVSAKDYYLHDNCERINQYIEKRWPKTRAILAQDYCKNPCATISIIGGVTLLLLAMAQTFFSAAPKLPYGD